MHVVRGRKAFGAELGSRGEGCALAIGNFDGVHRGHQALLTAARGLADRTGVLCGALTFEPHPARFFAPTLAPPMLLPLGRRCELLGAAGADFVLVEPFDADLAGLSAERFVEEFLVGALHVGHVVVGYDFSFGKGRGGNGALIERLGAGQGFGVTIVPQVTVDGLVCSSTKIREFLLEGRIEGASLLLGRAPELTGEVVRGAGRGRQIGVPTANLRVEGDLCVKPGIYAGRCVIGARVVVAAISLGTNPTFVGPGAPLTVEAHLLDFAEDLYGQRVRLELVARLRDEQRYDGVEGLLAQIRRDIEQTRNLVASVGRT